MGNVQQAVLHRACWLLASEACPAAEHCTPASPPALGAAKRSCWGAQAHHFLADELGGNQGAVLGRQAREQVDVRLGCQLDKAPLLAPQAGVQLPGQATGDLRAQLLIQSTAGTALPLVHQGYFGASPRRPAGRCLNASHHTDQHSQD